MRALLLACLAGFLAVPGAALAQSRPKLQITDVRIGFPAGVGRETGERLNHYKAGSWAPVYVDIQAGRDGLKGTEGRIEIIVETPDADDVSTNYKVSVALDKLGPNEQFTVPTYAKLAGNSDQVVVSLVYNGESLGQAVKKQQVGFDAGQIIYLTIGSRFQGLGQEQRRENPNDPLDQEIFDPREHIASIGKQIGQMPLHWFGYDGVDVVVLATGDREFLKVLETADKRYRQALADWVMRGGHLIVTVGQNQDALPAFPELQQLLPVEVPKAEKIPDLRLAWVEGNLPPLPPFKGPAPTVATLVRKPDRAVTPLLKRFGAEGFRAGQDLIVQGTAGLGRVTVVALDLDQRPFTDWPEQRRFWKLLMSQAWGRTAVLGLRTEEEDPNNPRFGMREDQSGQLLSQLYAYLENFEEVPVISFGWVALFIFLYILVVGPLDYFFLKKVVKRLELTWITFPTVVLTISAIAYFTAYYIKGKDLRIRKVDLVDVDLTASQPLLVGHTWFTLFSPRIQHYTVGIDPAPGDWVPTPTEEGDARTYGTVVSWLGRPETDRGGRNRGQGLFRRAYDYEPAASGLRGVPIQVWSTKSFAASWQAAGDPNKPLLGVKLREQKGVGGGKTFLTGEITWLPGESKAGAPTLTDAFLLYNNSVVKLTLEPGKATPINTENDGTRKKVGSWFRDTVLQPNQPQVYYGRGGPRYPQGFSNLDHPLRAALFFEELDQGAAGNANSGLRLLDQSWRLKHPTEAVLLARVPVPPGPAEVVAKHMATASRLWLGEIPTPGGRPPALEGIMRQDTFVRVFLPVQVKE
jgi:hypothetical protein